MIPKKGDRSAWDRFPLFYIDIPDPLRYNSYENKSARRELFTMKILNPVAASRFTNLREAAQKIDRLLPHVRYFEQQPNEMRPNASVALEFPTPMVILNSTVRQALSFLFAQCDTVQTDKTERGICFTFTVSDLWLTKEEPK